MKTFFSIAITFFVGLNLFANETGLFKVESFKAPIKGKAEYTTIKELLEQEYSNYFYETDDEGNTIIEANPDQMILNENGFYIFYFDVYGGKNGEGDQGIGLAYTEDFEGNLIDYEEIYTGSFGDSFNEDVWVYLIPNNKIYIETHLDGIENIEWVDGYPTGDSFSRDTYKIGEIDERGMIEINEETEQTDEFSERYIENTDDALIKDIRTYYGMIEKGITNKTFTVKTFTEGNKTYQLFSDKNYLKRLSVTEKAIDNKLVTEHFYFKVNTCFLYSKPVRIRKGKLRIESISIRTKSSGS